VFGGKSGSDQSLLFAIEFISYRRDIRLELLRDVAVRASRCVLI
jgi:hypothetical protein